VYEQLDAGDTLETGGAYDPLDEGVSPPERSRGLDDWGTTAAEVAGHESLSARLAASCPSSASTPGRARRRRGHRRRAARRGGRDLARGAPVRLHRRRRRRAARIDVGIDGAGSSAEEAAVHLVDDDRQR
jgi:hypothetical protein